MAQTTSDVLFGPVFIVPAQSIMYLVIRTYIYNRTFVSIKKKRRKMKKKTHLWPVFVVGTLPEPQCRVFRRFQSIYTIKHKFSIEKKKKTY